MQTSALPDPDEQELVRRVVVVLCGLGLLTVPLLHVAGVRGSWVSVAHVVALGGGFLALGRTRLSTRDVVVGVSFVLWAATLVSVGLTASGTVTGTTEGAGLGSGAVWLAAATAPAVFLVLGLRRAVVASLAAVVGFVLMLALALRGAAVELVDHPGLWQVGVAVLVIVGATASVAWLAGRSADERRLALLLRQEQAAETARLEASQRRRSALFSQTASQLREPMAELAAAVDPLRVEMDGPGRGARTEALVRVQVLAGELLDQVVEHIDGLVDGLRRSEDEGQEASDREAEPEGDDTDAVAAVLMTFGVFAMVGLDAYRVALLGDGPVPDAHAVAAAANRMVVVLFLASAILAVRFPGRFGWWLTGLVVLAHPLALLGFVAGEAREVMLPTLAAAWRIAVVAAGMLAVLAMIIERRVRDRDAFVAAASGDEARSAELRRREEAAERAYAEAAHELKNPLSVVQGAARTLQRAAGALSSQQETDLRTAMLHGVDRLEARLAVMRLVADDGDGAEVPDDTGDRRPVAATDVLLDALAAARGVLGDRPIDVDVRVTGEWTAAPPSGVEHVLENLLSNAHKYGDRGVVRLTAHREGDDIVVEVVNRGGGLSRADAARIFEPYWRAANADERASGTGIGLAIVQRLVHGWGGRCWARVGGGWTRVGFTMPVAATVQAPTWQQLQDQLG